MRISQDPILSSYTCEILLPGQNGSSYMARLAFRRWQVPKSQRMPAAFVDRNNILRLTPDAGTEPHDNRIQIGPGLFFAAIAQRRWVTPPPSASSAQSAANERRGWLRGAGPAQNPGPAS